MAIFDKVRDFLPFGERNVGYGVVDPVPRSRAPKPKIKISPRIIALLVGLVIVAVLVMVCTNMLNSMRQKPITLAEQLVARCSNSLTVIDEYTDELRSSSMRTLAASLRDTLSGTSTEVTNYLTENHGYDLRAAEDTEIWANEVGLSEAITTDFENARLNGILDRTFAREAVLLIAEIISIESEIMARSDNEALKTILQNSTSSLQNLSNGFEEQQVGALPSLTGRLAIV